MSAEVRPNGNETQYEILHNASVIVGALVGGADGSVLSWFSPFHNSPELLHGRSGRICAA